MLIVAIPKSASSALADTLADLHDLRARQLNISGRRISGAYSTIAEIHNDQHELDQQLVARLFEPGIVSKNHIVPTAHNQNLLQDRKKVILLRKPEEIILSYRRAVLAGEPDYTDAIKSLFDGCHSEEEWLERARENGLLDELRRFRDGWQAHEGDKLVIDYKEVVNHPKAAINRIERYLAMPMSDEVKLHKTKYTRATWWNLMRRSLRAIGLFEAARRVKQEFRNHHPA